MILHSMDRSKPPLREDCFIDTGYIRCPPILFTVLSPQWEGIVPFEVDILLDFFHDYYTEKFVNKIKLPIHITDINTTKTKMKRFIQQLLSVQVYRGEFPVLHSSSSAIDTVHWIAIFLSWDCVTGRKIHNHLNPADKILWASPWGQWFVVHTHRKLLEHTRIHRKKNNTPHHSPPLWYQLNQIISQWL